VTDRAAPVSGISAPLTDAQIAGVADALNSGEIEQAKVARTKSTNKDVTAFASMMIEHHGQAQKQQPALGEGEAVSPLSMHLADESKQTVDKLNQAEGKDFDRQYIQAQVDGHQQALDTLTRELLPNAKSPELKRYLQKLQPRIEQHLARARTLSGKLAGTSPDTSPARSASR